MPTARWSRIACLGIALILTTLLQPSTPTKAAETASVIDYVVVADECYQLTGTLTDGTLTGLNVSIPGYQACINEPEPMVVRAAASSETKKNTGYLLSGGRCFEITTGTQETQVEVALSLCATTVAAPAVASREDVSRREAGYDLLAGGCVNTVIDVRSRQLLAYFTIANATHCREVLVPSAERTIQPTDGIVPRRIASKADVPLSTERPEDANFIFDSSSQLKVTASVNLSVAVQNNQYVFTASTGCCFQQHHWYLHHHSGNYYYLGNTGTNNSITFTRPLTIQGTYKVELLGRIWNSSGNYWDSWSYFSNSITFPLASLAKGVEYRAHVAGNGWLGWVQNGAVAGTTGQSRRAEAIQVKLRNMPAGVSVCYQAHVAGYGWLGATCNGGQAGTTGQSRRMEAAKIWLVGAPAGCNINYQAHVAGNGWLGNVSNGAVAGTTGQSRRMEAIRIWLSGTC